MWRSGRRTDIQDEAAPDPALVERLQSAARSLHPTRQPEHRALFLRAVAERRASIAHKERASVFDLLLGRKRFAIAAAAVLALGTAGAVGASGGVSDAAGNVADVLAALNITDRTPDVADEHIDDIEPAGGEAGSPSENANDNANEGSDNADDGIGNSNASDTGLDHASDNADEGAGNAEDGAGNADDAGAPSLPDAAGENAPPDPPADTPAGDHADLPDAATDPPGGAP